MSRKAPEQISTFLKDPAVRILLVHLEGHPPSHDLLMRGDSEFAMSATTALDAIRTALDIGARAAAG